MEEERKATLVIEKLEEIISVRGISKPELAEEISVPYHTLKKWLSKGKSRRIPSKKHMNIIEKYVEAYGRGRGERFKETARKIENLKYLLLLTENELSYFRDATELDRDQLRAYLNTKDVGYVASLLTMILEEKAFETWRKFNTYEFERFKKER